MATLLGTFIQIKLFRIKADITKCTKDFLFDIPLIIGEGSDWKAAKISKLKINSVEMAVKPAYNFCTQASSEMGKVSVDFPVRLAFYSGNTVGEKEPETFSEYMLDSKVELGTATTGVKARFGSQIFRTLLTKDVISDDDVINVGDILQKEQSQGWTDNFSLTNNKVVLQKGRIVVCVKLEDLIVDKENLRTEDESGNGNGSARRVIRAILGKSIKEEVKEEKKAVKGARRQPAPEPQPQPVEQKIYCDNLAQDGTLMLDYPFYITQIYDVTYMRTSN